MRMKQNSFIFLFLFTLFQHCNSMCQYIMLSGGNYYDMNPCLDDCINDNILANSTDGMVSQLTSCCTPLCQSQVQFHTSRRIAIIVVSTFLLFFLLVCCFFGCFGPLIQQSWILYKERKKYIPYTSNITPQQFDKIVKNFTKIFTQQQRKNWQIIYTLNKQTDQQMIWNRLKTKKITNYQYQLNIQGLDIFGSWIINGYLIYTFQGSICWGLKNYTIAENHTHVFDHINDIMYELVLQQNDNYQGKWFSRNIKDKQGNCWIRKKQYKKLPINSNTNIYHDQSQQIISIQSYKN